jgi:prepilin-type processing-associated H-X9-DG protein
MLRSHRAAAACRSTRVLTIELVELVVSSRAETLRRLCEFVGVPVDAGMVAWFDGHVTAAGMHPGRWRRDFDEDACRRIDAYYAAGCDRLRSAGVDIPQ